MTIETALAGAGSTDIRLVEATVRFAQTQPNEVAALAYLCNFVITAVSNDLEEGGGETSLVPAIAACLMAHFPKDGPAITV